jgi:hypothetical protein
MSNGNNKDGHALKITVTMDEYVLPMSLVTCSPAVQALKDYVDVNVGPYQTNAVPIFQPRGGDQGMLTAIGEHTLMGLMQPNLDVRLLRNLLVAFCITKGMQGCSVNVPILRNFAQNKFAPGVPNAIKIVCQTCGIDPTNYPSLGETVRKLEYLWDSIDQGKLIQPTITYKW